MSLQNLGRIVLLAAGLLLATYDSVSAQNPQSTPEITRNTVNLQVYKKWIGASGDEAPSEIHLTCGEAIDAEDDFGARFISKDRADGWDVQNVPDDGVFCSVLEIELDTFIADTEDCRELLVIAGQTIECTVVNTKVVKRIDMLNRYGRIMMIAVMLGAGLAAVKRFAPV